MLINWRESEAGGKHVTQREAKAWKQESPESAKYILMERNIQGDEQKSSGRSMLWVALHHAEGTALNKAERAPLSVRPQEP